MKLNLGVIYFLINPGMPGLIKIGKTTKTANQRAAELSNNTAVPFRFIVGYEISTNNIDIAEEVVHVALNKFRALDNREFFKISLSKAIKIANRVLRNNELIVEIGIESDYKFLTNTFYHPKDLFVEVISSQINWEEAKLHYNEGYFINWLRCKNEFSSLIAHKKGVEKKYNSIFLLSVLIHSVLNSSICTFLGFKIPDLSSLSKVLLDSSLFEKYLNNKDFIYFYLAYNEVTCFANKKLLSFCHFFKDKDVSDPKYYFDYIDWLINPDKYLEFRPYKVEDLGYLFEKEKYDILYKEYYIPSNITSVFEGNSYNRNQYFKAIGELKEIYKVCVEKKELPTKMELLSRYKMPIDVFDEFISTPLPTKIEYIAVLSDMNKSKDKYLYPSFINFKILNNPYQFEIDTVVNALRMLWHASNFHYGVYDSVEKLQYMDHRRVFKNENKYFFYFNAPYLSYSLNTLREYIMGSNNNRSNPFLKIFHDNKIMIDSNGYIGEFVFYLCLTSINITYSNEYKEYRQEVFEGDSWLEVLSLTPLKSELEKLELGILEKGIILHPKITALKKEALVFYYIFILWLKNIGFTSEILKYNIPLELKRLIESPSIENYFMGLKLFVILFVKANNEKKANSFDDNKAYTLYKASMLFKGFNDRYLAKKIDSFYFDFDSWFGKRLSALENIIENYSSQSLSTVRRISKLIQHNGDYFIPKHITKYLSGNYSEKILEEVLEFFDKFQNYIFLKCNYQLIQSEILLPKEILLGIEDGNVNQYGESVRYLKKIGVILYNGLIEMPEGMIVNILMLSTEYKSINVNNIDEYILKGDHIPWLVLNTANTVITNNIKSIYIEHFGELGIKKLFKKYPLENNNYKMLHFIIINLINIDDILKVELILNELLEQKKQWIGHEKEFNAIIVIFKKMSKFERKYSDKDISFINDVHYLLFIFKKKIWLRPFYRRKVIKCYMEHIR